MLWFPSVHEELSEADACLFQIDHRCVSYSFSPMFRPRKQADPDLTGPVFPSIEFVSRQHQDDQSPARLESFFSREAQLTARVADRHKTRVFVSLFLQRLF